MHSQLGSNVNIIESSSVEVLRDAEKRAAKVIAMYFPQFHAIPENDSWWGKGFTDWNNVRAAQPQFEGHYQPRLPLGGNYYDQSDVETIRWQVGLAKEHGIYGFCHYHYWFDGRQLLETPTNLLLANKDIDMPFCLSWANETWSRRWDGRDHHILIKQTHPPTQQSWRKHYGYLIEAWTDPRAIKVDGKPVFAIYRPHNILKLDQMLAYWRELAHVDGLPGLYFLVQKQYEIPDGTPMNGFDGVFQFQPFEAIYSPTFNKGSIRQSPWFKLVRRLPEPLQDMLRGVRAKFVNELTFYDYEAAWEQIVKIRRDPRLAIYPGAFMDWDNAPRYKRRATVFRGASPELFSEWFGRLIDSMPERNLPENFIFLNAWNEWSEGAYLEPDERYGYQYLQAVKNMLREHGNQGLGER